MPTQAQINSLVDNAVAIANDDSHGYSNVVGDNYGNNGDFDCGGLVSYSLYKAGLLPYGTMFEPNERYGNSWSYGTVLEPIGFVQMPFDYNSVKKGDILIKDGHHTELAIGNYQQVGAHDNYDGVRGDYNHQGEISVVPLSQNYWDYMYRPTITDSVYSSKWEVVSEFIKGKTNKQIEKLFKTVFHSEYYYSKYKAFLQGAGVSNDSHDLLQHFLNDGMGGNMQGSAIFDPTYFEQSNADLVKEYGQNYPNYYIWTLMNNKTENRRTYLCTDVPADESNYKAIKYCIDKGYFKLKKVFGVELNVSRLHTATVLYKLAGKPTVKVGELPYSDIADVSTTGKKALQWCYDNKIMYGYKNGTFRPDKAVTKRGLGIYLTKLSKKEVSIAYTDKAERINKADFCKVIYKYKGGK